MAHSANLGRASFYRITVLYRTRITLLIWTMTVLLDQRGDFMDAEYVRKMGDYDAEELAALEVLPAPVWTPKANQPEHGEPWFTLADGSGELPRAA